MNTNKYQMREARQKLTEILQRVLAGEEIILTKYNIPQIKLVKVEDDER